MIDIERSKGCFLVHSIIKTIIETILSKLTCRRQDGIPSCYYDPRERDQESGGEASNCCICLFGNGQLPIEGNEAIYISANRADICPPCFACLRKGTPLQTLRLGYFSLSVKYHNCFADISVKCSTFAEKCGII